MTSGAATYGPILSVVIGVFNAGEYITGCLESLYEQDLNRAEFEVLVVDGGSTDGTVARVQSFMKARAIENLRILPNERRTLAAAFNVAVPSCRGRFVAKLDAQGRLSKGYYRALLPVLLSDERIGLIGGRFIAEGDTTLARAWAPLFQDPVLIGPARYRYVRTRSAVDTAVYGVFRKDALEEVGAFDERILRAEDTDFNLRLRRLRWKIVMEPTVSATYYVRRNLGAAFRQFHGYAYWRSFVRRKHHLRVGIRQVLPVAWLLVMVGSICASLLLREWLWLLVPASYGATVAIRVGSLLRSGNPWHWLNGFALYPVLHAAYAIGTIQASLKPRGWTRSSVSGPIASVE